MLHPARVLQSLGSWRQVQNKIMLLNHLYLYHCLLSHSFLVFLNLKVLGCRCILTCLCLKVVPLLWNGCEGGLQASIYCVAELYNLKFIVVYRQPREWPDWQWMIPYSCPPIMYFYSCKCHNSFIYRSGRRCSNGYRHNRRASSSRWSVCVNSTISYNHCGSRCGESDITHDPGGYWFPRISQRLEHTGWFLVFIYTCD